MLSNGLMAMALVPLAVIHGSSLIGFLAVLTIYGGLGFFVAAFGRGFLIGFSGKDSCHRCVAAAALTILIFTSLRVAGMDPAFLRPFGTGAMCLGNVMYFLGLLIISGREPWARGSNLRGYLARQAWMLLSLLLALFFGHVFALPSMANTATTFLVLWTMEKQLEVKWGGWGIVVLFANFLFLYFVAHYLHTHPEHLLSLFDPSGIYCIGD